MENEYSVLMPLWYKEKIAYLKLAINSVLNQTVLPAEVVFVKDHEISDEMQDMINKCFQDSSVVLKIIEAFELFGKGLGAILARGVENCEYSLIARMDSDDISLRDRCEKELIQFSNNPNLAIVGGSTAEFSGNINNITGYRRLPEGNEEIKKYIAFRCPFNHPTVMYKKDIILKVGNYSTIISKCEDYDLWYRIIINGYECCNITDIILYYRAGNDLIKRRKDKIYYATYAQLTKKMLKDGFINNFNYIFYRGLQALRFYSPSWINQFANKYLLRSNK